MRTIHERNAVGPGPRYFRALRLPEYPQPCQEVRVPDRVRRVRIPVEQGTADPEGRRCHSRIEVVSRRDSGLPRRRYGSDLSTVVEAFHA